MLPELQVQTELGHSVPRRERLLLPLPVIRREIADRLLHRSSAVTRRPREVCWHTNDSLYPGWSNESDPRPTVDVLVGRPDGCRSTLALSVYRGDAREISFTGPGNASLARGCGRLLGA